MATPIALAVPDDIQHAIKHWNTLLPHLPTPYLRSVLQKSRPQYLEGNSLAIITTDISSPELLKKREEILKEAMLQAFGKEFNLMFMSEDVYNARRPAVAGTNSLETFTELLGDSIEFEN